ncbi:MAG: VWA domain-containing protein [Ignavibacteriaceae bacterium]|nr:VWA domain-containing protein [Ignavibacteriaceae bacterium]
MPAFSIFNYDIRINLAFNPWYLLLLLLVAALYTWFYYRITIPKIDGVRKFLFSALRILSLATLLFVAFEPVAGIVKRSELQPVTYVFIDRSRSITFNDGTGRTETVNNFLSDLKNQGTGGETRLYSFGSGIDPLGGSLSFTDNSTNINRIFSTDLFDQNNVSSVVIVSDGNYNTGSNPLSAAEKTGIPVFTIGIGDSSRKTDLSVKNILHNEIIYAGAATPVTAVLFNTGLGGREINLRLLADNRIIESKRVVLSGSGFDEIKFTYTPETPGQKKITVNADITQGELISGNNSKSAFVTVLNNKLRVSLISGAPSADVGVIKNTLKLDTANVIFSSVEAGTGVVLDSDKPFVSDSTDILILVNFPAASTSDNLLNQVTDLITKKNTPFLIFISRYTDFQKLKNIEADLPFIPEKYSSVILEAQPEIQISSHPVFQPDASLWNNLPPAGRVDWTFRMRAESELLATAKVNNVSMKIPMIAVRKVGYKRSVGVVAGDVRRWNNNSGEGPFGYFITNSVRWLHATGDRKQVIVRTDKLFYSQGEEILFTGELYDESFFPKDDGTIAVDISGAEGKTNIRLERTGNGIYEGKFRAGAPGDYSFTANGYDRSNKLIGSASGRFNAGEFDAEMQEPALNAELMNSVAEVTGGSFYYNREYTPLFEKLKQINTVTRPQKVEKFEVTLWTSPWMLAAFILFFCLELFLRKREGML